VEYETFIAGLEIAIEIGFHSLCLHSDSQLIVNEIIDEFQTRGEQLTAYLRKVKSLLDELEHHIVKHIPWEDNHEADSLAKQASMGEESTQGLILVRNQAKPRFEEVHKVALIEEEETWFTPIIGYLSNSVLPTERNEHQKLLRKASHYTIQDDILYCCGFSNPLLRCVAVREVNEILHNIHQGSCGDHTGGKH